MESPPPCIGVSCHSSHALQRSPNLVDLHCTVLYNIWTGGSVRSSPSVCQAQSYQGLTSANPSLLVCRHAYSMLACLFRRPRHATVTSTTSPNIPPPTCFLHWLQQSCCPHPIQNTGDDSCLLAFLSLLDIASRGQTILICGY